MRGANDTKTVRSNKIGKVQFAHVRVERGPESAIMVGSREAWYVSETRHCAVKCSRLKLVAAWPHLGSSSIGDPSGAATAFVAARTPG